MVSSKLRFDDVEPWEDDRLGWRHDGTPRPLDEWVKVLARRSG